MPEGTHLDDRTGCSCRCYIQWRRSFEVPEVEDACFVFQQRLRTTNRSRKATEIGASPQRWPPAKTWSYPSALQSVEHGGRVKQRRVFPYLRRTERIAIESDVDVKTGQEKRLGVKGVVLPKSSEHLLHRSILLGDLFVRSTEIISDGESLA